MFENLKPAGCLAKDPEVDLSTECRIIATKERLKKRVLEFIETIAQCIKPNPNTYIPVYDLYAMTLTIFGADIGILTYVGFKRKFELRIRRLGIGQHFHEHYAPGHKTAVYCLDNHYVDMRELCYYAQQLYNKTIDEKNIDIFTNYTFEGVPLIQEEL